jgi:hypothetical protein
MIVFLVAVAFVAGFVDSIAGGGGLLTVPALLSAGLGSDAVAIATNKGQAIFGSMSSMAAFAAAGKIDRPRAPFGFAAAAAGSLAGALLLFRVPKEALRPIAIALLAGAALVSLARRPDPPPPPFAPAAHHPRAATAVVALVLGAYDGFFGPGTGTLLLFAYVLVLGDDLVRASANAKVANFASNLAAFCLFASQGSVRWQVALPMGFAQLFGAWLGTQTAVRRGTTLVRKVAVAVSLAIVARLAWQMAGR